MFKFRKTLFAAFLFVLAGTVFAQSTPKFPGVGRDATPKEVAAWDIDVRPDFKGLPVGSGSVSKGQDIWESKCAACHGFFGESGEVFSPLVGGVTKEDIKTGRVANLTNTNFPGRTTFMKVATLSTIWDYINRAMPWTAPKTLSSDEVYAVTAFLLNLNGIVPDGYVLSDKNIKAVQELMPNRNGMTPHNRNLRQVPRSIYPLRVLHRSQPQRNQTTKPQHLQQRLVWITKPPWPCSLRTTAQVVTAWTSGLLAQDLPK